jgi:hypothetical protein
LFTLEADVLSRIEKKSLFLTNFIIL